MTTDPVADYQQHAIEHALAVRQIARDLTPLQVCAASDRVWCRTLDQVARATDFLVREGVVPPAIIQSVRASLEKVLA